MLDVMGGNMEYTPEDNVDSKVVNQPISGNTETRLFGVSTKIEGEANLLMEPA